MNKFEHVLNTFYVFKIIYAGSVNKSVGKKIFLFRCCMIMLTLWGVVGVGSLLDDTLYLKDNGIGYLEHKGLWAFTITIPIMLISLYLLLNSYYDMNQKINRFFKNESPPSKLNDIFSKYDDLLFLKNFQSKAILFLFFIVGFLAVLVNIKQTFDPVITYGNDVFDSKQYLFGFILAKIYLWIIWGWIYPTIFYILLIIMFANFQTMSFISKKGDKLDVFNQDNCGGTSIFGDITSAIMIQFLCVFFVIIMLINTHSASYLTLVIPLILSSIFFILFSYFTVIQISAFVKCQKKMIIETLNKRLDKIVNKDEKSLIFLKTLKYKEQIIQVHSSPYVKFSLVISNSVSFIPIFIAVIKIVQNTI